MALGTPVAAATAYNSAAGTTTVAPAYPSGILATDVVLLFVGQKPSTANSGTVTTPTGWTLREELTGAGGYGTTLGADTGNTNLRVYSWNTPVAGQTGTLNVTLGTNNISWAFMVRIPTGGGAITYGSADGQRTTQPTSPMSIALTNGATATNFQAGDLAIWAMCIPTDVTTPGQFSAQSVTASGATFATAVELNEPDSGTNNDIGGYSAYASVTAGSSTTAPTVTATLTGTLTNVRGPVVLVRVRETLAAITGDLDATETGSDTASISGDVVVQGSVAATEVGSDTFAATGTVTDAAITGSMAATETGSDVFASTGTVFYQAITGTLAAIETGSDTLSSEGVVRVAGTANMAETGSDIFAATGTVPQAAITGSMAAVETTTDTSSITGTVLVRGTANATETGSDVAGTYVDEGYVEPGYYLPGWYGTVLVQGAMAATESGSDIFQATGSTNPEPVQPTERGDGVDARWTPKQRRERDRTLEQERERKDELRQLLKRALDPVAEASAVEVVTVDDGVVVIPAAGKPVAVPRPEGIDLRALSREVGKILSDAKVQAERTRRAQAREVARVALKQARENLRRLIRKRQQEEFLLLMT